MFHKHKQLKRGGNTGGETREKCDKEVFTLPDSVAYEVQGENYVTEMDAGLFQEIGGTMVISELPAAPRKTT